MVSQRRKLLDYLKRTNADSYRGLIERLVFVVKSGDLACPCCNLRAGHSVKPARALQGRAGFVFGRSDPPRIDIRPVQPPSAAHQLMRGNPFA